MLQSLPRLRFNKEGNLLAVTTADHGFKILASAAGLKTLKAIESTSFEGLRPSIESTPIKVQFFLSYENILLLWLCFVSRTIYVMTAIVTSLLVVN